MYTQFFLVEVMAYEHSNDLLKKADAHRLECQVKQQHLQAKLLGRAAMRLSLLIEQVSQFAHLLLSFTDKESPTANY